MLLNEKTLAGMVASVTTELVKLCEEFQIPESVVTEVNNNVTELLRSKSTSTTYTLRIDRWPVGDLQKIFDRSHCGGADFTAKTWIEIVMNYTDEKVTIKRSPTEKEPAALYEKSRTGEVEAVS